jgi:hypothetical protein
MIECLLTREEHVPQKAVYPVIDAHNHLWAKWQTLGHVVQVMDEVGVAIYCDLTSNVSLAWGGGGYLIAPADIQNFFGECDGRFPHRFYGFTTTTLTPTPGRHSSTMRSCSWSGH